MTATSERNAVDRGRSLALNEVSDEDVRRAQLAVAARAVDPEDCALLLDALGLLGAPNA